MEPSIDYAFLTEVFNDLLVSNNLFGVSLVGDYFNLFHSSTISGFLQRKVKSTDFLSMKDNAMGCKVFFVFRLSDIIL